MSAKKIISYFLSLLCILSVIMGDFGGKVYAVATEYEAHVAVFCDNTTIAKQYVERLCSYEYDAERDILGAPGSGKSTEKAVITDGSRKYNVYFHVVDSYWASHPDRELNNLIKACTCAIIVYDVLDPALEPILKSRTHYKEDIESLLPIDTPLNNCIKYLQSFGQYGWWNAINFIMYNKEKLPPELQSQCREQLNLYTLGVEDYYVGKDNKWNRNHPAWNTEGGISNTLGWIPGQIFRSIFGERYLTGEPGLISKKKQDYSVLEKPTTLSESDRGGKKLSQPSPPPQKELRTSDWDEICKWLKTDDHSLKTMLLKAYKLGMKPEDLKMTLEALIQHLEERNEDDSGDIECVIC